MTFTFYEGLLFLSSVPFIFLEVLGNLSIGVQKRFIYPKHIFVTACRDPLSHIEMGWMDEYVCTNDNIQ